MQITNDQILGVMPPQFGLFGLLFAFMNRLQAAGGGVTKLGWFKNQIAELSSESKKIMVYMVGASSADSPDDFSFLRYFRQKIY